MNLSLKNTRRLTCPRCKSTLRVIDMAGFEFETCPNCRGVWFDQQKIQTLLRTTRDLPNYVPPTCRSWTDSELMCPLCARSMRTLQKNSVFPFDIEWCQADNGYWFDGEELDQVVTLVQKKTLRLKPRSTSQQKKMERQMVQRQVARIKKRNVKRVRPARDAPFLQDASFFDLPASKKILALIGVPVEFGGLYEWRSWTNLLIILANVIVFALMMFLSGSILGLIGLFPETWYLEYGFVPKRFSAAPLSTSDTLFTSMFIHGGILHLLGNMFFLFTTGDDVEKRFGHIPFLCFYLLVGMVGALASVFAGVAPSIPRVGASGAVAGVMGAYLALCRHKSFYVWLFRIEIFGKMISVSAWLYLVFWFGSQLLSLNFGNPGIDYWAHIGGFAFGFMVGKVVQATQSFNGFTGQWEWRWDRQLNLG